MKVIHGSLRGLLQEVKDHKVETVRVAAFMQSDVVANGLPSSSHASCSMRAPPMPWTVPPAIWPSTTFGLIMRPQSSLTM